MPFTYAVKQRAPNAPPSSPGRGLDPKFRAAAVASPTHMSRRKYYDWVAMRLDEIDGLIAEAETDVETESDDEDFVIDLTRPARRPDLMHRMHTRFMRLHSNATAYREYLDWNSYIRYDFEVIHPIFDEQMFYRPAMPVLRELKHLFRKTPDHFSHSVVETTYASDGFVCGDSRKREPIDYTNVMRPTKKTRHDDSYVAASVETGYANVCVTCLGKRARQCSGKRRVRSDRVVRNLYADGEIAFGAIVN